MDKNTKRFIVALYFFLRLPAIVLIRMLFCFDRRPGSQIGKILVIRLDRIGDFVTSLPVIDNLKAAYPNAGLDVLVRPYMRGLARLCNNIDGVIEYRGFARASAHIRKARYDLVIDLLYDYKLLPALLAFLSAAPLRAGFAWGYRELFFNRAVRQKDLQGKNMIAVHLEILKPLGIQAQVTVPRIRIDKKKPGGQLVLGIHPGGHFPSQCWHKDRFSAVAQWAVERHHARVYVFAGPDEKELVSYIVNAANHKDVRAVFPDTEGLVRLISQCDILLCNNSGPLHVATALEVPTVSTMGPTDPLLWMPQSPEAIAISKHLLCSPCGRAVCAGHACMDSITVEEVEKAVEVQIHRLRQKQRLFT
ncbi:MAG TPA: glycosyltransferase family 9 protein [Candidatus Omnitrophota bacterium]|nr:glycosyltransferase family 9 protein [Candidatus Omnitrophota bacterium]HQJ15437.1 glycosyltransferase family 9 protein [Candidatus Omnitrophota bacterium]